MTARAHIQGDVTNATIHILRPDGTVWLVRDAHIQQVPRYITPFKPKTMAKTKTATISKTRHKGNNVFVVDLGATRIEDRFTRLYGAAVGAGRACTDFLKTGGKVKIVYPDGRYRTATWAEDFGGLCLGLIITPKKK